MIYPLAKGIRDSAASHTDHIWRLKILIVDRQSNVFDYSKYEPSGSLSRRYLVMSEECQGRGLLDPSLIGADVAGPATPNCSDVKHFWSTLNVQSTDVISSMSSTKKHAANNPIGLAHPHTYNNRSLP